MLKLFTRSKAENIFCHLSLVLPIMGALSDKISRYGFYRLHMSAQNGIAEVFAMKTLIKYYDYI